MTIDPRTVEDAAIGLISVIVPAFDAKRTVPRCVDSVIGQTYPRWELVLVDDGSTDGTGTMCDEYAASDRRIRAVHTENRGPASARNAGMKDARGAFYYFLDADDFLDPDALESLAAEYRRSRPDLIVSGCKWVDRDGKFLREESFLCDSQSMGRQEILGYLDGYLKKPNCTPMFTCVWGRLFDASIIRDNHVVFDETMHVFEDADFNFRYLRFVRTMAYLNTHSYNYTYMVYYISASTRITDHPEKIFDHFKALKSLSELFLPERPGKTPEQVVGHACVSLTIIQLVRLCGQSDSRNRAESLRLLRRIVDEPLLRRSLLHYFPGRGESKLLPSLLRLKMVRAIMAVCRYKAHQRYGKA